MSESQNEQTEQTDSEPVESAELAPASQGDGVVDRERPKVELQKRGPWAVWWLGGLTFGVYYVIWYQKINNELAARLGVPRGARGSWWSQLIPVFASMGLHRTAKRLNAAHEAIGSPTRVGTVTSWLWAPAWFMSQTRYLQRRLNSLHDLVFTLNHRELSS